MNPENTLQHIKEDLWNINRVGTKHVEESLIRLIPLHALDQFIPILQECILASKERRGICQYLQLIDHLLNYPQFSQLIHCCLSWVFLEIVSALQKQHLLSEIERAKVIRKQWLRGRIHPHLYAQLRQITFRQTKIDVDVLYEIDAILYLGNYYLSVLKFSHQQLLFYLPQYLKVQHKFPINSAQNWNQVKNEEIEFHRQKSMKNQHFHGKREQQRRRGDYNHPRIRNDPHEDNSKHWKEETKNEQNESVALSGNGKRTRYTSLETNISEQDNDYIKHPRRLPKIEPSDFYYFEQIPEIKETPQQLQVRKLRNDIKSLCEYQCKECGLRFILSKTLKEHQENHVVERIKEFRKKEWQKAVKIRQKHPFQTLQAANYWIKVNNDQKFQESKLILSQNDEFINIKCEFCSTQFQLKFKKDHWFFQNAIRVELIRNELIPSSEQVGYVNKITKKKCLMHISCARLFECKRQSQQQLEEVTDNAIAPQ